MSYIKTLSFNGLKGCDANYTLAPITYIQGPNKSNKTSIIDAIRVALLGYYPKSDVPKTNAGTMLLASSASMGISLAMADGRSLTRNFLRQGEQVKKETTPEGFEVDPRLALCLDHSLYFSKSDNDKVQQIINMAQNIGDDKRIPEILARLKSLRATNHDGRAELILHALLKEMPQPKTNTVQMWLAELLEYAKDSYRTANAAQKEFMATNRTLTEANALDSLNNDTQKADAESRRAQLIAKRDTLNEQWGREKEQYKQYAKALADKAALTEKLQALQDENMPDQEVQLQRAQEAKSTAESKRLSDEADVLTAKQDALADKSTSLNNANNELSELLDDQHQVWDTEARAIKTLDHVDDDLFITEHQAEQRRYSNQNIQYQTQIDAIAQTMDQITSQPCCPTCRTTHTGWKAEALDRFQKDIDKIRLQKEEASAAIGRIQREIDNHRAELDKVRLARIEEHETKRAAAETATKGIEAKATSIRADLSKLKEEWTSLGNQARELREKARAHSFTAEQCREILDDQVNGIAQIKAAQAQLQALVVPPERIQPERPAEMVQVDRDIFEVESAITLHNNQEAERKRIEQLKAVAADRLAAVELTKKIGETVKEEQAKIVDGAFEPVLKVANTISHGLLATPLTYTNGRIGRAGPKPGSLISVSTFSGSETQTAYMAITAALAREAKDRIGIIDEIGNFDAKSIKQLLENSASVIEQKMLDQIIIVGTALPETLPEDVLLIKT